MVNFLSTSAVGLNGGGSPLAEASASSTLPPWQQEELLYEPPLRASHGFVTTHYTEGGHEDHITSFPTFTEQEESSMGDSSGGFVLASSQQDPLAIFGPLGWTKLRTKKDCGQPAARSVGPLGSYYTNVRRCDAADLRTREVAAEVT